MPASGSPSGSGQLTLGSGRLTPRSPRLCSVSPGQIAVIPLQAVATMAATDRLMREALVLFGGLTVKDVKIHTEEALRLVKSCTDQRWILPAQPAQSRTHPPHSPGRKPQSGRRLHKFPGFDALCSFTPR